MNSRIKLTGYRQKLESLGCIVAAFSICLALQIYEQFWPEASTRKTIYFGVSETVEDIAKVTINGLYKIAHGLSIAAKMYNLE